MNYEFCELVVTQMIVFKLHLKIVFVVSTLNKENTNIYKNQFSVINLIRIYVIYRYINRVKFTIHINYIIIHITSKYILLLFYID